MMKSILIVDEDRAVCDLLEQMLQADTRPRPDPLEVHRASGFTDALSRLSAGDIDVLLVALHLGEREERDGIDLIDEAQKLEHPPVSILMSARTTARDYEAASDLGVIAVLKRPPVQSDLDLALERAARQIAQAQGNVQGVSLLYMFQMFHLSRRSGVVHVMGSLPAEVHFCAGEIVHAEYDEGSGESALRALLQADMVSIRTTGYEHGRRTINRRFKSLMLDVIKDGESATVVSPSALSSAERMSDDERSEVLTVASESVVQDKMLAGALSRAFETIRPSLFMGLEWSAASDEPSSLRTLDELCGEVVVSLEGVIGCALIELRSGGMLGCHHQARLTATFERSVAVYVHSLFRGAEVTRMKEQSSVTHTDGFVDEVLIRMHDSYLLAKALKGGRVAVMLSFNEAQMPPSWGGLAGRIAWLEERIP